MDKNENLKYEQNKFVKTIVIIISLAIITYFIMLWISPESKNLGSFMVGFGVSFAGIVVFAFCIKYISDIYKQIKEKR